MSRYRNNYSVINTTDHITFRYFYHDSDYCKFFVVYLYFFADRILFNK